MKTLEQLGISPAPWKVDDREFGCDNEISCEYTSDIIVKGEKRTKVVARCNAHFDTYKPDAILIAAAPKLYAACYEMLRYYYEQNTNTTVFNTALELMKQAVAEAAGESEVAK